MVHTSANARLAQVKAQLKARLDELGAGAFQSDINGTKDNAGATAKAKAADWWQPWL